MKRATTWSGQGLQSCDSLVSVTRQNLWCEGERLAAASVRESASRFSREARPESNSPWALKFVERESKWLRRTAGRPPDVAGASRAARPAAGRQATQKQAIPPSSPKPPFCQSCNSSPATSVLHAAASWQTPRANKMNISNVLQIITVSELASQNELAGFICPHMVHILDLHMDIYLYMP